MKSPYIDIHTHSHEREENIIKISSYLIGRDKEIPQGYFSAGILPWSTQTASTEMLSIFTNPPENMVAIGEIGLDFAAKNLDKAAQYKWFSTQLAIAEKLRLPVILHCVKAYNEVLAELNNYNLEAVIFHSFIGSKELLKQLIDRHYCVSIGSNSLRSPKTIEALKSFPENVFFIETDDSGDDITRLYMQASSLSGRNEADLRTNIYQLFKDIFDK